MSVGWSAPAGALLEHTPATWPGLWSLLYTAGHCALRLSLVGRFSDGIECAYVAMDLREARDELEWLLEGVAEEASTSDLGPLRPGEDRDAAGVVVDQLISTALDVCRLLAERVADGAEIACLTRVEHRLLAARTKISELSR